MRSAGRRAPSVQCCPRDADRGGRAEPGPSCAILRRPCSPRIRHSRLRSRTQHRAQADPDRRITSSGCGRRSGPPDHRWSDGSPSSVGSSPTSTRCAPDAAGSCCWQANRGSASPGSPRSRRRGDDARAAVAWGRCHRGRGAPAFWPWTQVMQSLIAQFPADTVVAALGRRAADVSQLVPEVHGLVPGLEPPPSLGPEFERFRLCDALTRSIRALASEAARRRARGSPLGRRVVIGDVLVPVRRGPRSARSARRHLPRRRCPDDVDAGGHAGRPRAATDGSPARPGWPGRRRCPHPGRPEHSSRTTNSSEPCIGGPRATPSSSSRSSDCGRPATARFGFVPAGVATWSGSVSDCSLSRQST